MDISNLLNTPYGFHAAAVCGVIIFAILVFVFGFKTVEEPQFDKFSDDRKPAGKKRKVKDKKSQANGHITTTPENKKHEAKINTKKDEKKEVEKSPSKDKKQEKKSPAKNALKEIKDTNEVKKVEKKNKSKGKENILNKNKKNIEYNDEEDDGEWEQAVSRRDKRSKKAALEEIMPQKQGKKKEKKSDDEDNSDYLPDTKIVDVLNEIGLDAEAVVDIKEMEEVIPVTPAKEPKKTKKKKGSAEGKVEPKPEVKPAEVKPLEAKAEAKPVDVKPPEEKPKPPRQPVRDPSPPEEKPKSEEEPKGDTNVVFDELGDAWKEAKAPKKSSRKKTRVD